MKYSICISVRIIFLFLNTVGLRLRMFGSLQFTLFLIALAGGVYSASASSICTDPSVTVQSFSTEDGTVLTSVAYVAEFKLSCSNGATEVPLYAELPDKGSLPAVHISKDSYQVSWTEEVTKAGGGHITLRLYDEESYARLRKAARTDETSSGSSGTGGEVVEPLITLPLYHPDSYKGPWLNSELLAALTAAGVSYLAYSAKSQLLA